MLMVKMIPYKKKAILLSIKINLKVHTTRWDRPQLPQPIDHDICQLMTLIVHSFFKHAFRLHLLLLLAQIYLAANSLASKEHFDKFHCHTAKFCQQSFFNQAISIYIKKLLHHVNNEQNYSDYKLFFVKDTATAHLKHYMRDHFMLC